MWNTKDEIFRGYRMGLSNVDKDYKKYLEQKDSRWQFGNMILYRMCQDYPNHNNEEEIVGKILLIGRTYAAAIERRKTNDEIEGDDFYYEKVGPKMKLIGSELDRRLERLKESTNTIEEDLNDILSTHKLLVDTFYEITGMNKRSLASKYLHFHCPEKFFIYDSRARNAIAKYVDKSDKGQYIEIKDCDQEYGDFVCRMIKLQKELYKDLGTYESPRKIDSFLLSYDRMRK